MTIAGKFNLLIAAVAVVASVLLVAFVGHRDFTYQRDALVLKASSLIASKPYLQLMFYYRDERQVNAFLDELLTLSPAVKRAVLHDPQGEIIASRSRWWGEKSPQLTFSRLREGLAPMEIGVSTELGGTVPEDLKLLRSLTLGERTSLLTVPIASVVNPLEPGLTRTDFATRMADPDLVRSLFVTGFVELSISSTLLWQQSLPSIMRYAGIALAIVLVLALIARSMSRRITAPLGELARVAYDIAMGKHTEPMVVRGTGEVSEIANVLNGMITGLHRHTRQMNTDRKMLNLKVSEQTEQLTQRSEQLDQAVRKVSETRDKLRHMAYFDSLTSLPNRRLFTEQLALLLRLASRSKEKVGLLLIDIDNFKRINESLGTGSGDKLLREIADRLAAAVREGDVLHRRSPEDGSIMDVSRMGGDEFTVVLNRVENVAAAKIAAERIAQHLGEPMHINKQEVICTATIGIALAPDHADSVESLLTAASTAAKFGKRSGRNRVAIYDSNMEGSNRDRLQLETDLRKAIERDQLLLHFQPQVHSDSGEVLGVEALVRWKHPELGLVPPVQWIPMAEELGIIDDVGKWVLNDACRTWLTLNQEGVSLPKVSVNVSAQQFKGEFVSHVDSVLRDTGMPPHALELELTESIMINDEESTNELVASLKALGVRLSIDDFGTGYSSLSYLSRFPLDSLKIDRSFVLGLAEGKRNKELVRAIISLGHSLGLDIVVEGVERLEELQFFRSENARVIQGFLFAAPAPVDKLRTMLKEGHFAGQLQILDRILDHSLATTIEEA